MARLRRHRRRVRRARKGKKSAGRMSNNTKVDERITLKYYQTILPVNSASPPASYDPYVFTTWSPQNSNQQNVTQSQEWSVHASLYDEFKVTSMTVSFTPAATQNSPLGLGTANTAIKAYSVIDRNSTPLASFATTSVPAKFLQLDSCRTHSMLKPWSRTLRVKNLWCSTQNPIFDAAVGGPGGVGAQPWVASGALAVLALYSEKIPTAVGAPLGQVIISFRCQFRGKKPSAYKYDPLSGSVIITPLSSYTQIAPQNPPQSQNLVEDDEHFEDVSGNIIIVSNATGEIARVPH